MMKRLRRNLALLLCWVMMFSLIGMAPAEEVSSGTETSQSETDIPNEVAPASTNEKGSPISMSSADSNPLLVSPPDPSITLTLHALNVVEGQASIKDASHEMTASEITKTISVSDGDLLLPKSLDKEAPEMAGWKFVGWYTSPVKYAFWGDYTTTGAAAVELPFTKDCNGTPYNFTVDKTAHPNATHTLESYWRWLSTQEGGVKIEPGDPLDSLGGKTDLYACYEPTKITYTMDFRGWNQTSEEVLNCTRDFGTPFGGNDVDENGWEGYQFLGWFSEDGTVGPLTFYDIPQNGVRYVAHWQSNDGKITWENYQEHGYKEVTGLTMRDGNTGSGMKDLGDTLQLHAGSLNFKTIVVSVTPADSGISKLTWNVTGDTDAVRLEISDNGLKATVYATSKAGKATITVSSANGCSDSVTVDTTGHSFDKSEVVKWGNCANPTIIIYTCVYCGTTKQEKTYSRHDYAYRDVPATCTEPHKWVSYCKVCGQLNPEKDRIWGEAPGHDFDIFQAVGCGGTTTTKVCQTCGYTETSNDPGAASHNWSKDYVIDKRPTCHSEGSQSIKCLNCGATKPDSSVVIPADSSLHVWSAWVVETEATEMEAGSQTRTCSVCGMEDTRGIPPTSYKVDDSKITDGITTSGSDQLANQAQANAAIQQTVDSMLHDGGSMLGEDIRYAAIQDQEISTEICVTSVAAPENAADAANFNALLGNGATVFYMDIDIFVKAGDKNIGRITQTDSAMTFTAQIPSGGRIVQVLRAHEGTVETIPCWIEGNTVYFTTDKFSTFAVSSSNDISLAAVETIPDQTHTGSEIKPAVKVTINGNQTLTEGTDYSLTYANNVNVGTASVTITGMGSFSGSSKKVDFRIVAAGSEPSGDAPSSGGAPSSGSASSGSASSGSSRSGSEAVWSSKVDVDWNAAISSLDAAAKNSNVNISTGTEFVIPVSAQQHVLKDKVTLACQAVGTDITITLSSRDVKKPKLDIALSISNKANIPEAASKEVTDTAIFSRVLNIGQKKMFSQKMNMHMVLGMQYAGKLAVMYSYDENTGKMRYESSFRITKNGLAMFPLQRGDEYVIVVTDKAVRKIGVEGNYRVVAGDTLSKIAARNGVTLKALLNANPQIQNANRIYVGEMILIPGR